MRMSEQPDGYARTSARLFQLICMDDGASGCRPSCWSHAQKSRNSGNGAVASLSSMILVIATARWQRGSMHWAAVGSGDARARVRFAHTCCEAQLIRRLCKG